MKKLALVLSVLFLLAGFASATEYTMDGWFEAQGKYENNLNAPVGDEDTFMYYDSELTVNNRWQISDSTQVFFQLEVRDMTWGAAQNMASDDNLFAEEFWGRHTFGSGLEMQLGLFGGNAWGTDFGDEGGDEYAAKFTMPMAFGTLIAKIEKETENVADNDDTDHDQYILGAVLPMGGVTVMPLVQWSDDRTGAADVSGWTFALAATGSMGAVGFEGEFIYATADIDMAGVEDPSVWGAYGNVWSQMGAFKVGGWLAYGSYDDDANTPFTFGDNFGPGGSMIWGDGGYLTASATGDNFGAGIAFGLYGAYTVSDALSFTAASFYYMGDSEAGVLTNDASAWEVNVQGAYVIADGLKYTFGVAYAAMDYDKDESADPDDAIEAYQKFSFSF
jgi:hypothetical protein